LIINYEQSLVFHRSQMNIDNEIDANGDGNKDEDDLDVGDV